MNTYDEAGRLLSKTSEGKTTTYQYTLYDKSSQLTETVGDESSTTSYTYDSEGNLISEVSPDSITTAYSYDAMGKLLKTTVTGSDNTTKSVTTYTYNPSNGITTVTDTEGNTVTSDYDNATGLLTQYTDAKGNYKTYTYDALGRTKTVTGTTVVGGTLGNIVNQYTYDGDKVTSITHNGFSYIFGYDQYGHKTSVSIGDSNLQTQANLVTYAYNDTNNKDLLTSIQYANNQSIGYSYNTDSKLTSTTYNGNAKFEYQYDTANKRETIIDRVNNVTYTVQYDDSDRITSIAGTDGSSLQYQYIKDNIVSSVTSTINGTTKTTSYSYDDSDKLIGITTVNGSTLSYAYDSLGRTDHRDITLANGSYVTAYTYTAGTDSTTTGKVASISNNGTVTQYTYDANNNISTITSGGKVIAYTYNSLDELVREENQVLDKTIVYSYDAGGNILSKTEYPYTTSQTLGTPTNTITYTYGDSAWKDKLTSYNGNAITYDAAGNTLTYNGYTFSWEAGRQLAAISGNGKTISYKYNDSGYRTEKTVNGVTTKYYLDGDKVVLENTGSDSIYYSYDTDNKLVSMTLNGTEYFYIRNGQGDITGLIDTAGTQVVNYIYDSWGKLISIDGSLKDTVGLMNPYRYRGYRYDAEMGLFYVGSRYYDPEIDRFINADEVIDNRSVLGTNLYAYCWNNPVNMHDPTGYYAATLVLPPSAIASLSGALAGIMASISASMVSIKAAIATSWFIPVCIAATAIAIVGVVYAVNRVMALSATAASTISAVKTNVNKGGVKNGGGNTVYVITRKYTTDVVYVGRTCNFYARKSAHQRRFPQSVYTMIPVAAGLSLAKARALEQTLITAYTIDTLKNMINSISPRKWGNFMTEFNQMGTLIQSWVDPE